jgi:hypothetical protein
MPGHDDDREVPPVKDSYAVTRTSATTNKRLDEVIEDIDELIGWALADADHAVEHNELAVARDDMRRADWLKRARAWLRRCKR